MKKKLVIVAAIIMILAVTLIGGAYATGVYGRCPQNSECTTPCDGSGCAGCPSSGGCGGHH